MYGQRRGLAHAQQQSDDQARSANLTLMQQKRKRQLEEQLQEKLDLQRQYSNLRGIGMKGGSVPQRDLDLLNEQIEGIKRQIAELNGTPYNSDPYGSAPPTPSTYSAAPSTHQTGQSLATPSGGNFVPTYTSQGPVRAEGVPVAVSRGPASAGRPQSRREQVWNAKYQQWLVREREAASRLSSRGSVTTSVMTGFNPALTNTSANSAPIARPPNQQVPQAVMAHQQQQQAFQQQQQAQQNEVRYGRRATPPTEATRPAVVALQANQPHVYQQQWQQHNQSGQFGGGASNPSVVAGGVSSAPPPQQQQQTNAAPRHGRRSQQSTGLW